jgi:hypothetical protein
MAAITDPQQLNERRDRSYPRVVNLRYSALKAR